MGRLDLTSRKIVLLGCGGVGKCVLWYLPQFFRVNYFHVHVVDKDPTIRNFPAVHACIEKGAKFHTFQITHRNIVSMFDKVLGVKEGDVVIDLTTRTETAKIFAECRRRQLFYINTDIYTEDTPTKDAILPANKPSSPEEMTIRATHVVMEDIAAKTEHHGNTTQVFECGMNPGLISMFVKKGILDIARWVLSQKQSKELRRLTRARDYGGVAKHLGIRVIHCSEIDTQKPKVPLEKGKLYNTWSCIGLVDEGLEPLEIAVGTHEKKVPVDKKKVFDTYPQILVVNKEGIRCRFRSYVPLQVPTAEDPHAVQFQEILGVAVHHGETITLNKFLGRDDYAPTMHYVYKTCPTTAAFVAKSTRNDLIEASIDTNRWKVMNVYDEKLEGTDNVGACFLLDHHPVTGQGGPWGWWCGTMLDTQYTQEVLKDPFFGPTTIQVMAGMLSGLTWALKHPKEGWVHPETMDEREILRLAKKYLGRIFSGPIDGCRIAGTTMQALMHRGRELRETKIDGSI